MEIKCSPALRLEDAARNGALNRSAEPPLGENSALEKEIPALAVGDRSIYR